MSTDIHRAGDMDAVAGRWSPLARTLHALPNWLRAAESRDGGERHYTVFDGPDGPRGGLVARLMGEDGRFRDNPLAQLVRPDSAMRRFLGPEERRRLAAHAERLAAAGDRLYPALVSVLPGGCLPGLLRGPAVDAGVVGELLHELRSLAAERGAGTTAVMHVPEADTELRGALAGRGYVPFVSVGDCVLSVAWKDFEGYLAGLRGPRPTRVRREIRGFEESGAQLRETTPDALGRRHAELHLAHLRRNGQEADFDGSLGLIESIRRHPTGRGRVLEAWRGDTLAGFVVFHDVHGVFHPTLIGVGPQEEKAFTHVNLCYYGLIRIAVAEGARSVVYGPESYDAKAFRGCAPERRISHLRVPEELREAVSGAAALVDAGNRRRLSSYAWQDPGGNG